jgi:predicted TIM-barrel fold metal-dependent hydrolase
MTRITDFHAHAFPDSLADRAIATLQSDCDQARAVLDGRISSLLASMDRPGIRRSVICSIATKPDQFDKIVKWSRAIASDRIVPLASIHPSDPDLVGRVDQVADAGLKGIKLHPYYQEFILDAPAMMPLYRELLMSHPPDRVLFGTDSPWRDQGKALALLRGLDLPADLEHRILEANASALLDSAGD